ncbi:MAG TPA: ATP-binding protein [Acidimicrobiia bacterium]|nr:ATP-binding protein [Acidimicrobiia bacterium]
MTATILSTESSDGSMARFRASVQRRSVALGWVVVIVLGSQAVRESVFQDNRFLIPIVSMALLLVASAILDWDALMARTNAAWAAWAWIVAVTVSVGVIATVPELRLVSQPLFFGLVALSGLVLEPPKHAFVTILSAAILALTSLASEGAGNALAAIVVPVMSLATVAVATAMLGIEFERAVLRSGQRLEQLQRQRIDFERLYAVMATLSRADSLSEVLPQLVGTICRYLDAQVGVVLLYVPERHALDVMSPIWVNGLPLDIGPTRVRVSEAGLLPQVFRSGRPALIDQVNPRSMAHGLLAELGLEQAMVAPLRVEQFSVGVIAVGDAVRGSFRPEQLEQLASLAAPAALVLSQIGRYEAQTEMNRKLEEVAQMKTDFVSVVSHELRTPLTSIIGSLDTVNRPELAPEANTARELIVTARRQAGRLQRLIEDLLMVSRLDRDAIPINIERVPVGAVAEHVADALKVGDVLRVDVEPEDMSIVADRDHVERILINLIENAMKYAPGSPVEIVGRIRGDMGELRVVDHGPGIPPDQRERVFERFTQIEASQTRSVGGTGLGLSIVRSLAEAMEGRADVDETPGGGATFIIDLPVVAARPAPASR